MHGTRTRLVTAALVAALALTSVGCGGSNSNDGDGDFHGFGDGRPDPAGTSCPQTSHCYAQAEVNPHCGNISSSTPCLTGFQTFISFTGNVQRGDGYLTQEFWLSGYTCHCWIETGWLVSAYNPSPTLFWAQQTGDGHEFATLATARYIGAVDDADGSSGRFSVVRNAAGNYDIRIDTARVAYRGAASNPMWDDLGYGYVLMGMELIASTGAATGFTFFSGNRSWTAPRTSEYLGSWAATSDTDDPPFGGWLVTPKDSAYEGGVYYTQCCLPLHGASATNTGLGPDGGSGQVRGRVLGALAPSYQSSYRAAFSDDRPEPPPLLDESLLERPGTEPEGVPALDTIGDEVPAFDPESLATWMASTSPGVPYDGEVATAPKVTCPVLAADADKLLPEPTGLEADRVVCVGQASGTFTTGAPVDTEQPEREPLTADKAYVVVDAATGNLLVAGAYRRA